MNMELQAFLSEVGGRVSPAKEPTLFSVGGRGYYENPATDLLAFFLKPHADHGLKDLFLLTFLECLGEGHLQLGTSDVEVTPQVQTGDGKWIDLQVVGPDWCLIIENKIYHLRNNPFESYEEHAKKFGKRTLLRAILSPDGTSEWCGWTAVSHQQYCQALRERMAASFFNSPLSKWHIFAREFILHMENELYTAPITSEDVSYVEKHFEHISAAKRLEKQYREFIRQQIEIGLQSTVPGIAFNISYDDNWGFPVVCRCRSPQWGTDQIVLYHPEGAGQNKSFLFGLTWKPFLRNDSRKRRQHWVTCGLQIWAHGIPIGIRTRAMIVVNRLSPNCVSWPGS